MFNVFKTVNPDGGLHFPKITENADGSGSVERIDFDWYVIVDENADQSVDRKFVEIRKNLNQFARKGYVEKRFIGTEKLKGDEIFAVSKELSEEFFVRRCVHAQLDNSTGGDNSKLVASADFLYALAHLFSNKFTDFSERVAGSDARGPFQIDSAQWQAFLDANPDLSLNAFDRGSYYQQVLAAAFQSQVLANEYAESAKDASVGAVEPDPEAEQPHIPSYLNLLHCWLFGSQAALAVSNTALSNNPDVPIQPVLTGAGVDLGKAVAICALISPISDQATTVKDFWNDTEDKVNEAFEVALEKIVKFASEYLRRPTGSATWLAKAIEEKKTWDPNEDDEPDFDENSNSGVNLTQKYFKAVWPNKTFAGKTPAWCGAFAGFCVSEGGHKKTLMDNPALAANWINWGNVEIPRGEDAFPEGAVVVTAPAPNSTSSGHVTFYLEHSDDGKFVRCLGGNQGRPGFVKVSSYPVANIRAVRWLNDVPPVSGSTKQVMAQTMYGEAANQTREGQVAVANVIMNRVAMKRKLYGLTPKQVCLKNKQFSCWNENDNNRAVITNPRTMETPLFLELLEIAEKALASNGELEDVTNGATHYYADYIAKPSWIVGNSKAEFIKKIGRHFFYKNVD